MKYLQGYPQTLLDQVSELVATGRLGQVLRQRYQGGHAIRTDRALYEYVMALKNRYLRSADPVNKVMFDNRLRLVGQALGTHATVSRVQGGRLKAKREIRIAALFKDMPESFLRMITVHELAHLKERDHDKAFYQLCNHMEPDYHQLELDLRLYLTWLDLHGPLDWSADGAASEPA